MGETPEEAGRKLLLELEGLPGEQRLSVIVDRIKTFPADLQPAVFHFVAAAAETHALEKEKITAKDNSSRRLMGLTIFLGLLGLAFAALGVFFLANPATTTLVEGLGLKIQTQSVGLGSIGLGVILVVATIRIALKRI